MRSRLLSGTSRLRLQSRQIHNFSPSFLGTRLFHATSSVAVIKPFLLADIGEGITECEIIQWFVEPDARVEEWDKLCEVTSDKASVEITSRFSGVIKKLYYEPGDMVKVGKPLVDIDIPSDTKAGGGVEVPRETSAFGVPGEISQVKDNAKSQTDPSIIIQQTPIPVSRSSPSEIHTILGTPAVRHLTKELNVRIEDITGTGKNGRVLKEDVYQFVKQRDSSPPSSALVDQASNPPVHQSTQKETILPLTKSQQIMFKKMTKSLSVPHFLYADEIDFTGLSELRGRLNKGLAVTSVRDVRKLTFLPFIIKALSMSLRSYPILNARVDHDINQDTSFLTLRSHHNIGVAMDTPSGLLVPVIKNVSSLTVIEIASELARLQALSLSGKLTGHDLSGSTISVSNIGSIGGTYVAPVIVERETVILGIGKMRTVPAFSPSGELVQKQVCNFSWSADHRVIDGATMARAGEIVRGFVENPDSMVLHLR